MPIRALWFLTLGLAVPDLRAAVHSDLVYARAGGKDLQLDLYLPEASSNGRFPVVVWIHGGAWQSGSKEKPPAARLTARGYAVANINYRLSAEAQFPAPLHDAKAAVRWLRANAAEYGLDPGRFAAWGSSAGGHLAALLGTSGGVPALEGPLGNLNRPSRVQAVIDFFGPTDFLKMDAAGSKMNHDAPDSPESRLIGGPIQQNAEKAARANPITYVSPDDPAFLIMHGDKDPLVPHDQSRLLHEALKKAGVEASFETVKDAGHGFSGPEIDRAVDAFPDTHLKAPAASDSGAWADPDKSEPEGTKYRTFHSKTIKGDVSYLIYLPPGYETDRSRRYPVVYWLHGLGGNQRGGAPFVSLLDRAIRANRTPPAIAVLVNGLRDSRYCDSWDGERPVDSVVVRDLIPHIDSTWRTLARREFRAIEGYSMGGFGAAHFGFKYPELFGAVSIMAGALLDRDSVTYLHGELFERNFGGDLDYFDENSPWILAERNADKIRGRMSVRIGVGERDGLLERNRNFHGLLERLKIEHEYFTVPGVGHSGKVFYETLGTERVFGFYKTVFRVP